MKRRRLLALASLVSLALSASVAHARRAPPPGWQLEPGRAIGSVALGMSRVELQRLGPLAPHPSGAVGPNVLVSGGWTFVLDPQGRVRLARRRLALTPGVVLAGRRVAPSAPLTAIERMRIPGCSRIQMRVGGNVITCRGRYGWAHFTQGAVTAGHVEVDVSRDR